MTTIVTRAGKGSPLTHNEVDTNFTNLNSAKIESGDTVNLNVTGTINSSSATITGGSVNGTPIGNSSASTGAFTNLSYAGTLTGSTGIVNIGSGQLYKDASGKVGIGTNSPLVKLDIIENTNIDLDIYLTNNVATDGAYSELTVSGAGANQTIYFGTHKSLGNIEHYVWGIGNYPLLFFTNGNERLRIDASGNIISSTLYNNVSSGGRDVQIASNGTLYSVSSSLKYKTNIEDLNYSLVDNAITNLRPVYYKDKNPVGDVKSNWSHIGLIAEEAAEVEPRIVHYKTFEVTFEEEINENGKTSQKRIETELETPVPEGIDYSRLSILCLAELQKQREIITELKSRIELLENS